MSVYTIYKLTNVINDKSYIGFTIKKLNQRLSQHKYSAKNGSNYLIHKAIRKYGMENFEASIIYQSKDKEHTLKIMEPMFIQEYSTIANGYNIATGGQAVMLDRKHTTFTKEKMKAAWKNRENRSSWLGKFHSEESKQKISIGRKGTSAWNKGKNSPWTAERNKAYKGRTWKKDPTTGKRVWL